MKHTKIRRALSAAMAAACLAVSFALPASADTTISTTGGEATTSFTITAAASQMSVTVPTALAIDVTAQTVATVGTGTVTNNSKGVVEIKSITVSNGTYTLDTYADQETYNTYAVGSKKLGLDLAFGGGTDELTASPVSYKTGTDLTTATAKALSAGTLKIAASGDSTNVNTLTITPTASVSPTGAEAVSGNAASMVLVVGWYTGA